MKASKPVERVLTLLTANGYDSLGDVLEVGSVRFEFSAVMVGTRHSSDLIVVADTLEKPTDSNLRRMVNALGRALDMVESRRSVTLIVVGPQPNEITLRELSRVCRILLLGTPTGDSADDSVRDTLAVLLPLNLPDDGAVAGSPLEMVRSVLGHTDTGWLDRYLEAASSGFESVSQTLRDSIVGAMSEET